MSEATLQGIGVTIWSKKSESEPYFLLGNGYFVAPRLIATSEHVLFSSSAGGKQPVSQVWLLGYLGGLWTGTVIERDPTGDCALIRIDSEAGLALPLPPLGAPAGTKIPWLAVGIIPLDAGQLAADLSSAAAPLPPLTVLAGTIDNLREPDRTLHAGTIRLVADPERIIKGISPEGLCGMAILSRGVVIGHLVRYQPDGPRHMRSGILYAAPAAGVAQLRARHVPASAAPRIAPPKAGDNYQPPHYVKRDRDDGVLDTLKTRRGVLLYGPKRTGKTWFLQQLIRGLSREEGFVVVDPELMDAVHSEPRELCERLWARTIEKLREHTPTLPFSLDFPPISKQRWRNDPTIALGGEFGKLLKQFLAHSLRLVLVMDNAHRIVDEETWEAFFRIIKTWQQKAGAEWDSLRVILSLPERPSNLIHHRGVATTSPFNSAEQNILLGRLSREEAQRFFAHYSIAVTDTDLKEFDQLFDFDPTWLAWVAQQVSVRNKGHIGDSHKNWLEWAKPEIQHRHSHLTALTLEAICPRTDAAVWRSSNYAKTMMLCDLIQQLAKGSRTLASGMLDGLIRYRLWQEGFFRIYPENSQDMLDIYKQYYAR